MNSATTLAMQIVVHSEPERTLEELAQAVASAVASFLHTPPESTAADVVAAWSSMGARKIVRHARGAKWERAHEDSDLPFRLMTVAGIRVKVFHPSPIDEVSARVRRTQVSGHRVVEAVSSPDCRPESLPITLNEDLEMSPGKAAAAAGHAAQRFLERLTEQSRASWAETGYLTHVEFGSIWTPTPFVRIVDQGHTEVAPGSTTSMIRELPAL